MMRALGLVALGLLLLLAACQMTIPPSAPIIDGQRPTASPTPTAVAATATTAPSPTTAPTATPAPLPAVMGGRSAGDVKAPELGNTGYDVARYDLALHLDPAARRLEGRTSIEATATVDRLGQISLDFADGMHIAGVMVADQAAGWQYQDNKLVVSLPHPLTKGATLRIAIDYEGPIRPILSRYVNFAEVGMQVREDGSLFVMGEPDGARAWFPANDTPLDKATFRFDVTVPQPLVASATGTLRETHATRDGIRSVWEMDAPMAPYLANVMAAPYAVIEGQSPQGVPLRHYVPVGRRDELAPLLAVSGPALDWFAQRLGPYPFAQFGYTVVGLPGASLETQSNVLLSEKMLNENTLVHELVHQWLGNSVSLASWADIWRNEGFATYLTLLWERRDGDEAAIERTLNDWERAMVERPTDYPLGDPPAERLFASDSYIKGAWLAHMLRRQLGDATFYRALRTYLERYEGRAASRAEFETVISEVAGQDMRPLFDYWLDRRDLPTLDVTWTVRAADGHTRVEAQLCGVDGPPSPGEVEIVVQGEGVTQTMRLPLRNGGRSQVDVPFTPTGVAFDTTEQVLARETVNQVVTLAPCP